MKIVSYTMVNNEARVIESFVRYNYNFIDEMIFIDNGCTDGTIAILNALKNEGLHITVYDESLQPLNLLYIENKYINKVIKEFNPDIVIPLDADEYMVSEGNPREALEKLELNNIYYIYWKWYVMTRDDDSEELFIPKKMKYRLRKVAWHYSDGTPVTKVIIPAKYFVEHKLKVASGHHTVFGKNDFNIVTLNNIAQAHFRGVSDKQLLEKLYCYSMRDISALNNNYETSQRTNQKAMIEKNMDNVWDAAELASYGGYPKDIVCDPVELSYCSLPSLQVKYKNYAKQKLEDVVYGTGCEMAIKYYNAERKKRERKFLKPIVLWLDGVIENAAVLPNPSKKMTYVTAMANVRAYLTTYEEIRFLKANHRLIVTPSWLKFVPYKYVVVLSDIDKNKVQKILGENVSVITWDDYIKKIGVIGSFWCKLGIFSGLLENAYVNMKQNGIQHTLERIKVKLKGK